MGPSNRFFHDLIDHLHLEKVLRSDLEQFCRLAGLGTVVPQDGRAAFGGYNGVGGVFQHQDTIGHAKRERAAASSLADDHCQAEYCLQYGRCRNAGQFGGGRLGHGAARKKGDEDLHAERTRGAD